MKSELRLERITKSHSSLKKIKELYFSAFPKEERMPFWYIVNKTKKNTVDFLAAFDGNKFVGFAYIMKNDRLIYIQYLAINPQYRSSGYGSKVLSAISRRYYDSRIILEIEEINPAAENYDQRLRRKAFYEKNGFEEANIILDEFGNKYEFFTLKGSFTIPEYMGLVKNFRGSFIFFFTKPKVYFK